MPNLIIERKSETSNKARAIKIYIDEVDRGTIANGETRAYTVEVGPHEVVAKIDWCGSQKVTIDIAETPKYGLRLSGFKHGIWASLTIIGLILVYFVAKFNYHVDLSFLLAIAGIVFMYPLYYLTFGRHHYLKFSKVEVERS